MLAGRRQRHPVCHESGRHERRCRTECVDYKATVCLFMTGGNDPFNTVVATDPASWANTSASARGNDNGQLALPASQGQQRPAADYAQHRTVWPQLLHYTHRWRRSTLFDSGRAAIVANVGTLVQPTTLAQYKAPRWRCRPSCSRTMTSSQSGSRAERKAPPLVGGPHGDWWRRQRQCDVHQHFCGWQHGVPVGTQCPPIPGEPRRQPTGGAA
jgi:hypothetical protein